MPGACTLSLHGARTMEEALVQQTAKSYLYADRKPPEWLRAILVAACRLAGV